MNVIACSRPWCEKLAENLQRETGEKFAFVGSKTNLTVHTLEGMNRNMFFLIGPRLSLKRSTVVSSVLFSI